VRRPGRIGKQKPAIRDHPSRRDGYQNHGPFGKSIISFDQRNAVSEPSLVRADLGDTIQTGGAETGVSTCQSWPAWRRGPSWD